jgi:predicted ABC-type exoprotein transport system permease subunit
MKLSDRSSSFKSGLAVKRRSLEASNIIELVKQNDGTIFNQMWRRSPIRYVDSIILRIIVVIEPMPAKAKCRKIVTVWATLSLTKMKLVAYVNGTMPRENSRNTLQTLSY